MDELLKTLKIDKKKLIEFLHQRLEKAFKNRMDSPVLEERRIVVVITDDAGDVLFSRQIGYDDNVKINAKYWSSAFESIYKLVQRGSFSFGGAIKLSSGFVVSVSGPFGDIDFFESLAGNIAIELGIISTEERKTLSANNQTFLFSNFATS